MAFRSYKIPSTVMNLRRVSGAIKHSGLSDDEIARITGVSADLVSKLRVDTATVSEVPSKAYDRLREFFNGRLAIELRAKKEARA